MESTLEKAIYTLIHDRGSQNIEAVGNAGATVPEQVMLEDLSMVSLSEVTILPSSLSH